MKSEERLSKSQIGFMIILFEIGSTPLFLVGSKAKQDAWLSMSFGAVFGLLLLFMYLSIQQKQPQRNLFEMLHMYLGRLLGTLLSFMYILYFMYECMRNVRDFGEIIAMSLLPHTPLGFTMLILVLITAYAVYKGAQVCFRLAQLLLPVTIASYGLLVLLLLIMKIVQFNRLLPVMENGLIPVLKAAFPDIVSFPFGQMVIFLMLWNLRSDKLIPRSAIFVSYVSVALFVIFMDILNIAVLGPVLAASSAVPFLQTVQLISIARIFERLDAFVILLLYIGLFMKMTAFFLCAVLGLSQVTTKAPRLWVLPVGLFVFVASFLEPNFSYHIWLGFAVSVKFFPFFQVVIPFILWIVMMVRKKPNSI